MKYEIKERKDKCWDVRPLGRYLDPVGLIWKDKKSGLFYLTMHEWHKENKNIPPVVGLTPLDAVNSFTGEHGHVVVGLEAHSFNSK